MFSIGFGLFFIYTLAFDALPIHVFSPGGSPNPLTLPGTPEAEHELQRLMQQTDDAKVGGGDVCTSIHSRCLGYADLTSIGF